LVASRSREGQGDYLSDFVSRAPSTHYALTLIVPKAEIYGVAVPPQRHCQGMRRDGVSDKRGM
jgi:hypothetical protein